jgi:hypothetical protein
MLRVLRVVVGVDPLAGTDQRGVQAAERLGPGAVPARGTDRGGRNQARLAQYGQVLGDRRLGHRERGGDLPGGQLAVPDQAQDLAPHR